MENMEEVKEKVKEDPEIQDKQEPKGLSDATKKFNREVMLMVTDLIAKCEAISAENNLSIFLAVRAPGSADPDNEGREVDVVGFTAGRMIDIAAMVNRTLGHHKELLKAMRLDAELDRLLNSVLGENRNSSKEVLAAQKDDELRKAISILRDTFCNQP